MFLKGERLAPFDGGSNLYASARALGFEIDFRLFIQEFLRRGKLVRAFYHTTLIENEVFSSFQPSVDWLNHNGFAAVMKPGKRSSTRMASEE